MRFRELYAVSNVNRDAIFESVFNKYYKKGYFGKIDKTQIKNQQKSWFDKFTKIVESKDIDSLLFILGSRDSLCTREWFSRFYGVDIVEKSMKDISKIAQDKLGEI